jgi:membrane-associated phospholipid phosphatase
VTASYFVLVLGIVLVAAAGVLVYATTPTQAGWIQDVLGRLGRVRDCSVIELKRYVGALAVLLSTTGVAIIIAWFYGRLVRRTEPHVDVPFYNWTIKRFTTTGAFHHANAILTHMGNRPQLKPLLLVAAVVFGVLWRKRGWWIPALVLFCTFFVEKFSQSALKAVVDRGHPPTALGSFPSGGCVRLISFFGIIFYIALLTWPAISRRWRVTGWTVIAVLAFIEGFTRLFLVKHWATDVLGGWLYGTMLLLALVAATSCFKPEVATTALGGLRRQDAVQG